MAEVCPLYEICQCLLLRKQFAKIHNSAMANDPGETFNAASIYRLVGLSRGQPAWRRLAAYKRGLSHFN